jgi:N-acetylglucosamine-6-phosphate deacetylase
MATANPGRFTNARGVLRVGASADLIKFRWEQGYSTLAIESAIVLGRSWH